MRTDYLLRGCKGLSFALLTISVIVLLSTPVLRSLLINDQWATYAPYYTLHYIHVCPNGGGLR